MLGFSHFLNLSSYCSVFLDNSSQRKEDDGGIGGIARSRALIAIVIFVHMRGSLLRNDSRISFSQPNFFHYLAGFQWRDNRGFH